jgi:hypothetical protein
MTAVWPHGDPRDVARAIVADPRYDTGALTPPAQGSWLDDVWSRIAHELHDMLRALDHALGAHNPFDVAIGFVVIGGAFGLLGFAGYVVARSFLRGANRPRRNDLGAAAAPAHRSATALRSAALAAAHARRYREAAALLFASAMYALDERGRIAYDAARTPGEYRRLVRDPAFDALAGDAVVALFAAAEPRADLFERMNGAYDRFFDAPAR